MRIQLTLVPTKKFVNYRGCTLRLWEGSSSQGHRVKAIIESVTACPDTILPGLTQSDDPNYKGVEWMSRDEALKFEVDDGN